MADNGSVTLRSAPVLSDSKSSYLKALSLSTILGGYTFSAEESNVSISIPFHILQVCLYLVFPLIPFIIGLSTSPITAGIVSAIINCVLSAIIHFFGASSHAKLQREPLLSGDTLKQFTHIIKAKSILNILFSIAVLSALSFFSANFIAKSSTALAILVLITCLTTFFTLVGGCPQEFASVISTNADFSPSSSLHMRSVYLLTLFIVNISLDSAANNTTITVILPLLPLFFALGLLGPPYITTIYAIEKFNAYILGSSQGMASDLRLIISISSSLLAIIIIALISYTKIESSGYIRLISTLTSIAAFLLSVNFMHYLGGVTAASSKAATLKQKAYVYLTRLGLLITSIVLPLIAPSDSSKGLSVVSLILTVLLFAYQQLQDATIATGKLSCTSSISTRVLTVTSQAVFTVTVGCLAMDSLTVFADFGLFTLGGLHTLGQTFVIAALTFKMYKNIYSHPLLAGMLISEIAVYALVLDKPASRLLVFSPVIHAANVTAANLTARLLIWFYAIAKMNDSKKQKIKQQSLFNILTFTAFIPINLLGITVSSVLDSPLLPFLGLPLYFAGFPRPRRFWPSLQRSMRGSGESLLYEKFLGGLQSGVSEILSKRSLSAGEFFLIRIEKYLATLEILETGQNFSIVQLRGLESQEMTSCHSIEANQVDRIIDETFNKKQQFFKDCLGAVTPLAQFTTTGYEENQLQFTGIITDSSFVKGYKEILMKLIVYFIGQTLTFPLDEGLVDEVLTGFTEYVLQPGKVSDKFPQDFASLIQFDIYAQKTAEVKAQIDRFAAQNAQTGKAKTAVAKKVAVTAAAARFNLEEDMGDLFAPKKKINVALEMPATAPEIFNQPKQLQQPPKQQPPIVEKKKVTAIANNDLDDLLDGLSVGSVKPQKKKEIKPSQKSSNPFSLGKQAVATDKHSQASSTRNIVNTAANPLSEEERALNNNPQLSAAPVDIDIPDVLPSRLESSSQSSQRQPKHQSFHHPPQPHSQPPPPPQHSKPPHHVNPQRMEIHPSKKANSENEEVDDFLKNIMGEYNDHGSKQLLKKENSSERAIALNPLPSPPIKTPQSKHQTETKDNYSWEKDIDNAVLDLQKDSDRRREDVQSPPSPVQSPPTPIQSPPSPIQQRPPSPIQQQPIYSQPEQAPSINNKNDELDDFLNDLANDEDALRSNAQAPPKLNEQNVILLPHHQGSLTSTRVGAHDHSPSDEGGDDNRRGGKVSDKLRKLAYLLFTFCTNDGGFDKSSIDQELLFKHFKDSAYAASIRGISRIVAEKKQKEEDVQKLLFIMNRAVRYAIKITFDQFAIMGSAEDTTSEDVLEAIRENETTCSIAMGHDEERRAAIQQDLPSLWSLHYSQAANPLSIFRSAYKEIQCTLLSLDKHMVHSIWSNLAFELYYATNDDDERYSIQTHEQFFRNLIIQSAEEPLGYAPFYSGPVLLQF